MKKVYSQSLGNKVFCDLCDIDWTNLPDSGGFIFSSKAVCPQCEKETLKNIKKYNEERFIKAFCPENISFANFVREYRGTDAKIEVFTFDNFEDFLKARKK